MLDDLKYIHAKDAQDALGIAEKQWQQLEHEFTLDWTPSTKITNIVMAGMGGSALAGLIGTSWPTVTVPFEICRNYTAPVYVNENTLFVASSYSGNTEETLSALKQAEEKGAQIVILTSGGELQSIAEQKKYPILLLPSASQPRFGVLYGLNALVTLFSKAKVLPSQESVKELRGASAFIKKSVQQWLPTIPSANNPAKKLALDAIGKSPVIYAGPMLYPAAYKWKISFNENAKNVAWSGQLPEFNHNEFIGWSSHPVEKPYKVIDLHSNLEHERVQRRFEVSDRLLSGKRPKAHVVEAQGDSVLQHLLWTVVFGDFVSLYTALLNGLNPSPVDLIEKFKKEL